MRTVEVREAPGVGLAPDVRKLGLGMTLPADLTPCEKLEPRCDNCDGLGCLRKP